MIWMFLIVCVWFIIGSIGFVYWWTTEYNFTKDQIPLCFGAGIMGPFSWILGYFIHGEQKVIFKKRVK